MYLDQKQG